MSIPVKVQIDTAANTAGVAQTQAAFNSLNAQLKAQSQAIKGLTTGFDAFRSAQAKVLGLVTTVGELTRAVTDAYQAFKALYEWSNAFKDATDETARALSVESASVAKLRAELQRLKDAGNDVAEMERELAEGVASGDYKKELEARRSVLEKIQQMTGLDSRDWKSKQAQIQAEREQNELLYEGYALTIQNESASFQAKSRLFQLKQQEVSLERERMDISRAFNNEMITETQYLEQINRIRSEELSIAKERSKIEVTLVQETFTGRLGANMRELQVSWGNMSRVMADNLTSFVTSSVQGLSNALTNVIVGTQSAAQAFGQFALQMATSFIASVLQMILMAKVAIPILTALGVLSGGSTAATGAAVTSASLASTLSLSSGLIGRAAGGLIPGEPSAQDNRLAMVATGEYVARAAAVQYYGAEVFAALNAMKVPRDLIAGYRMPAGGFGRTAFADGGYVNGAGGINVAAAPVTVVVVNDERAALRALESHSGRKVLYRINDGMRTDLGIS